MTEERSLRAEISSGNAGMNSLRHFVTAPVKMKAAITFWKALLRMKSASVAGGCDESAEYVHVCDKNEANHTMI